MSLHVVWLISTERIQDFDVDLISITQLFRQRDPLIDFLKNICYNIYRKLKWTLKNKHYDNSVQIECDVQAENTRIVLGSERIKDTWGNLSALFKVI